MVSISEDIRGHCFHLSILWASYGLDFGLAFFFLPGLENLKIQNMTVPGFELATFRFHMTLPLGHNGFVIGTSKLKI